MCFLRVWVSVPKLLNTRDQGFFPEAKSEVHTVLYQAETILRTLLHFYFTPPKKEIFLANVKAEMEKELTVWYSPIKLLSFLNLKQKDRDAYGVRISKF